MASDETSTQADKSHTSVRQQCGLSVRDTLKFMPSLPLSLVLGVFTFVSTIEQQKIGKRHRDNDRASAKIQRKLERMIDI